MFPPERFVFLTWNKQGGKVSACQKARFQRLNQGTDLLRVFHCDQRPDLSLVNQTQFHRHTEQALQAQRNQLTGPVFQEDDTRTSIRSKSRRYEGLVRWESSEELLASPG